MLKTLRPTLFCLLLISFYSFSQKTNPIYKPRAVELNNKAVALMTIRKFDSALLYLNEALKIDPTYYIAYSNKSTIYCSLKKFDDALKAVQMALKVKPDLAEGWTFAGILKEKLGDTVTATFYYKKSIRLFTSRISKEKNSKIVETNRINRALSYILLGEEAMGHSEMKNILKTDPSAKSLEPFLSITKKQYLSQFFDSR